MLFFKRPTILTLPAKFAHHLYGVKFLLDDRYAPLSAPQTIRSAAVISCPMKNVRYAKWSSRESRAATSSEKAVVVGNFFASSKKAWVYTPTPPSILSHV